jgi:hypothetical protein
MNARPRVRLSGWDTNTGRREIAALTLARRAKIRRNEAR